MQDFVEVSLVGNLASDPVEMKADSGNTFCILPVLVNTKSKVKGVTKDITTCYDVFVSAAATPYILKNCQKGTQVMARGGSIEPKPYQANDGTLKAKITVLGAKVYVVTGHKPQGDKETQAPAPAPAAAPPQGNVVSQEAIDIPEQFLYDSSEDSSSLY